VIGGFCEIKRELLSMLSDEAYNSVQSFHSDSAVSFAIFLHHLGRISNLRTQQPPDVLLQAMEVCVLAMLHASMFLGDTCVFWS